LVCACGTAVGVTVAGRIGGDGALVFDCVVTAVGGFGWIAGSTAGVGTVVDGALKGEANGVCITEGIF